MCLILIKPEKIKFNDDFFDIAEKAFKYNDDGSSMGILRPRTDSVALKRGLMTSKELMLSLENADVSENDTLVVHFRQATQGSPCAANTHGFTITNNFENDFEKLEGNFYKSFHVFHNGGYSSHLSKPSNDKESDFSDTKLITKNLFRKKDSNARTFAELLYLKRRNCSTDVEFNSWINTNFPILSYNKTTLLSPNYGLLNIGKYITDDNGFIHSHGGYVRNHQTNLII